MFADAWTMYATNPVQSLQCIEQLLLLFQKVSGLNVNKDKSVLYPIMLDNQVCIDLLPQFSYPLIKDCWKYVGVKIPVDFVNFSKLNLETIDAFVKDTLQQCYFGLNVKKMVNLFFPRNTFFYFGWHL